MANIILVDGNKENYFGVTIKLLTFFTFNFKGYIFRLHINIYVAVNLLDAVIIFFTEQ